MATYDKILVFLENTALIRASLQFVQGPFHWTVVALCAVLVLKFLIIILCVSEYISLMKIFSIYYVCYLHSRTGTSFVQLTMPLPHYSRYL